MNGNKGQDYEQTLIDELDEISEGMTNGKREAFIEFITWWAKMRSRKISWGPEYGRRMRALIWTLNGSFFKPHWHQLLKTEKTSGLEVHKIAVINNLGRLIRYSLFADGNPMEALGGILEEQKLIKKIRGKPVN